MYLIDIATANPPYKVSQSKVGDELKKIIPGNAAARMIDAASVHSGIDSRYFAIADAVDMPSKKFYTKDSSFIKPGTDSRMNEYEIWSKQLSKQSVENLLKDNRINPSKINRIVTISCTGFFAPGLDHFLINTFHFPLSAKRTNIGFMGCAASIVGFGAVLDSMKSASENDSLTLLLSLELCSLHVQTEPTRDNILANMLFADGCAAVLFSPSPITESKAKLNLISTDSFLFPETEKFMKWKIGSFGFELVLSSELPKTILESAIPQLNKILNARGIKIDSIKHWALHPGGRAILDALQNGLCLSDEMMEPSRNVLKNFGNMSSASILFVLKELLNTRKINKDDLCCAVAFGPGLTMEVALFSGI